jgi:uncharacterized membrane protein
VKRALQVLFLVLALAALTQGLWQYAHLPERVMSHFDGAGRANGWMSRDALLGWQLGTVLLITVLFEGLVALQSLLPSESVNLPHRDYWLAPERRAATNAWISSLLRVTGCLLMVFFMALFHSVYRVNLTGARILTPNPGWLATTLTLSVLIVVVATLARFFRKPAV